MLVINKFQTLFWWSALPLWLSIFRISVCWLSFVWNKFLYWNIHITLVSLVVLVQVQIPGCSVQLALILGYSVQLALIKLSLTRPGYPDNLDQNHQTRPGYPDNPDQNHQGWQMVWPFFWFSLPFERKLQLALLKLSSTRPGYPDNRDQNHQSWQMVLHVLCFSFFEMP